MIESICPIRVRYAETDQMGVVYHGNYFPWFEVARVQLLDEIGQPYQALEEQGYLLPVIDCSARFMRPARFDDRLGIHTTIRERPALRITIDYRVMRSGELLAEGQTRHVFMSPQGQPLRPPAGFNALMRSHFATKG